MWHKHPQQQQCGVQVKPAQTVLKREAHAAGEKGSTTTCDVTGARQQGYAKSAVGVPPAVRKLENEVGSALP